jgi:hypothetical protein
MLEAREFSWFLLLRLRFQWEDLFEVTATHDLEGFQSNASVEIRCAQGEHMYNPGAAIQV